MRIATWNVNSLKARLGRVEAWIRAVQPDVLCIQETKMTDEAFPHAAFGALGYESAHHGEGRWNGVAVISKVGLDDVRAGFADGRADLDPDARVIWATCGGVRVASCYVPNGREVGHDHYHYKLDWLGRLHDDLVANTDPTGDKIVVVGDFNVAPDDRDVWSPSAFEGSTHVTGPERAAIDRLVGLGLVDVFRERFDDAGLHSWWDYRAGAFYKKQGMRIDLIMASPPAAEALDFVLIDRNERKGEKPSDHAPVVADFFLD
ncbi:MAG: exodeoxyribonuclease III [Acidimicrobiales bacterium]|jgi:exodeoxyribonuclease-3|nr:exodeoxyribonuclease III [Acidimicrobiales bacterium]|tara:strand:- start:7771 stop:8553 length:783 start_codon:yes stop_codon:yes gene_type:complete